MANGSPLPFISPDHSIFRIGRAPRPWAAVDWSYANEDRTFGNRFDDSEGHFRVLYAASTRLACFIETLARFRKPQAGKQLSGILSKISGPADNIQPGTVPASWLMPRRIGSAKAIGGDSQLSSLPSGWHIRSVFEPEVAGVEGSDLDLAMLLGQNRQLTQRLATLVFKMGYHGVAYTSRHGSDFFNWAVFEPFGLADETTSELMPMIRTFKRRFDD